MSRVTIKPGATFSVIAPGGYAILRALRTIAAAYSQDVVITSGTDGEHSGPTDPHKKGEAYDVRSKNMEGDEKVRFLSDLHRLLGLELFYFVLESPGDVTEHFHIQVRQHRRYTIDDLLHIPVSDIRV